MNSSLKFKTKYLLNNIFHFVYYHEFPHVLMLINVHSTVASSLDAQLNIIYHIPLHAAICSSSLMISSLLKDSWINWSINNDSFQSVCRYDDHCMPMFVTLKAGDVQNTSFKNFCYTFIACSKNHKDFFFVFNNVL